MGEGKVVSRASECLLCVQAWWKGCVVCAPVHKGPSELGLLASPQEREGWVKKRFG